MTAQRDAKFSPTPADRINLSRLLNPSAEDAMLGSLLTAELARQHFNIVTNPDADYILTCVVEDDTTETYIPARQVVLLPPNQALQTISGTMGEPQEAGPAEVAYQAKVVYHTKGIRLYLLANPKTHPGGMQIAWEGCVEAGTAISPEREPALIRALLEHFGADFSGKVTLAQ